MDFFLSIFFGPEATEARIESEEQPAFVNADSGGNSCVVA